MRTRSLFLLGTLAALALGGAACSDAALPDSDDASAEPALLPDGAPNPSATSTSSGNPPPPVLPDGAPNPEAGPPPADAGRDTSTPPVDAGRDTSTPPPVDAGRDTAPPPVDAAPPVDSGPPPTPGVVGANGPAQWDALSTAQKGEVRTIRSAFLHQSVGGDLEDGAQGIGYRFNYITSSSTGMPAGLNGGLFSTGNGNPSGKATEFRNMAIANKSNLRVAIMKFGYADVVASNQATARSAYLTAVNAIKAQGVRVLHVTPPFVYNVPSENAPKMEMRTWMMSTFASDVIFDLQDIESTEPSSGARCQRGGSWEICNSVRSTSGCPSLNQGVDSPSGQGHICYNPHAQRIAKAFLFAIREAGK
ncbi:MAG TPA: hypothetical protein PLR99_31875 [Polyangiaceae bacterium]|nr:hypothetical protein [Polyangiaceae bacterium]